jgi:hypothetical protein
MMFQMRTYQELDIPKHQNQEIGLYHASLIHMYSIYIYTPSGSLVNCYITMENHHAIFMGKLTINGNF